MKSIDRTFTYRPPYAGSEARCRVRIYTAGRDRQSTVVISELADNPGMSVTNASETIATSLRGHYDLDPKTTTWIEHLPPAAWREQGRKDEQFDQITYTWSNGAAFTPQ